MPESQDNTAISAVPAPSKSVAQFLRQLPISNVRTLAAIVLIWAIVSVITTTTAFIALRGDSISVWLAIFGPMILYYSAWIFISLFIYRLVEVFSGSPVKYALGAGAHVLLFLVVTLSLPFIVHLDDWRTWLYGARAPGFHTLAAVIYVLNLVGSFLIHFYRLSVTREREAREARLRSSLLENQLNLARMDALKMQVNPHFLFNALNSIAALIETDRNPEAYHATELLGGLLRQALDQSSDRFLSLEKEIEFLRRYIDVEKVRFGSRVTFETRVPPNCNEARVPALILQPLIENSIKHAVNCSARDILIELHARFADRSLVLELTDNGPGLADARGKAQGYGLDNIRTRLQLLYGAGATLEVSNRPDGGVRAILTLPADTPASKEQL